MVMFGWFGILVLVVMYSAGIIIAALPPIRIGVIPPWIGNSTEFLSGHEGIDAAVSHVNGVGGIRGRQIQFVYGQDTQNTTLYPTVLTALLGWYHTLEFQMLENRRYIHIRHPNQIRTGFASAHRVSHPHTWPPLCGETQSVSNSL